MKTLIIVLSILVLGLFGYTVTIEKHYPNDKRTNMRSYQIECWGDSNVIWDGERRVGVIDYSSDNELDILLTENNY